MQYAISYWEFRMGFFQNMLWMFSIFNMENIHIEYGKKIMEGVKKIMENFHNLSKKNMEARRILEWKISIKVMEDFPFHLVHRV